MCTSGSRHHWNAHGPWHSAWEPTWPFAKVPHILPFYPMDRIWAYFHPRNSGFWDTGRFSKLPYLGVKLGHWPKCQKLHKPGIPNFYPQGAKLSLFLLHRQRFPRYGPIFKIDIIWHETCLSVIVPEVAHIPSFYQREQNWAYFCSIGSGCRDKRRLLKLPYLGMKLGHWPKCQKSHQYPLSTPRG